MKPSLSLCMIVRDEEQWLESCLQSVQSIVDEIVIVDTGSIDATKAIAQNYGAKIYDWEWQDDFAAARNVSLEKATGDWILVLDADEVIAKDDLEVIQSYIQNPKASYYYLTQTTYSDESATFGWMANKLQVPEAAGYSGYVESTLARLFLNIPEIRFSGVVHEHASHVDEKERGLKMPVRIHHYGRYSSAEAKARKDDMYLRLGEEKVRLSPDDFHAWYELGVQYWLLENKDLSKKALQKSLEINPDYVRAHVAMAVVASKEGELKRALHHYAEVLRLDPQNVIPYLYLPALLTEAKDYALAEKILKMGEMYMQDQPSFFINYGVVHQAMGNYRRAIDCFRRALMLNEQEPLAYLNIGISAMDLGEWELAFDALNKAYESPACRGQAAKRLGEWFFRKENLEEALKMFEEAREILDHDPEILYQIAVVEIQRRQMAHAKEALHHIRDYKQFDQVALTRLVACHRAVGDESGARNVLEELQVRTKSV